MLRCQFCKEHVADQRVDGGWEFTVPVIEYSGKVYHPPCYAKIVAVARATGGVL